MGDGVITIIGLNGESAVDVAIISDTDSPNYFFEFSVRDWSGFKDTLGTRVRISLGSADQLALWLQGSNANATQTRSLTMQVADLKANLQEASDEISNLYNRGN